MHLKYFAPGFMALAACSLSYGSTLAAQAAALRWRYLPSDSVATILASIGKSEAAISQDSVHPRLRLLQRGTHWIVRGHFQMPSLTEQLHGWVDESGDTVRLALFSIQVGENQPRAVYDAGFEAIIGPLSPSPRRLEVYWVEHARRPKLLASGKSSPR